MMSQVTLRAAGAEPCWGLGAAAALGPQSTSQGGGGGVNSLAYTACDVHRQRGHQRPEKASRLQALALGGWAGDLLCNGKVDRGAWQASP